MAGRPVNVTMPVAAGILDFGPYVAAVHVPDADREGPAGLAADGVGDRVGRELGDEQGDAEYIGFEEEARSISQFESLLIPGLLQTEDYVRALLRGTIPDAPTDQVERRVAVRMARQALLDREDPPRLWSIMDEAAVQRLVGGRKIMRAQLARLHEAAERPNVVLQVIPFDAGSHPGMDGPFVILEFQDDVDSSIVYTDSASGSIMLDEEADVRRHVEMFQHLRAAALSPDATAALLATIAAET